MKILYLAPIDICQPEYLGVLNKIIGQINAFQSLGANVDLLYIKNGLYFLKTDNKYERSIIRRNKNRIISKSKPLYDWVTNNTGREHYELVYIRYANENISFIKMISHLKSINIPVYLEYPTFPIIPEKKLYMYFHFKNRHFMKLLFAFISFIEHIILSPSLKREIRKAITFSHQSEIYGIPTIKLNNAIDTLKLPLARHNSSQNRYVLIGVSNISPWHGYDRIIMGMQDYYLAQGKHHMMGKEVIFKIVGDGVEKDHLIKLVEELNIRDKVIFTGPKYGGDLDNEFNNCDIGIGCLAIYRNGLLRASSLKVREYCARGVPFINNDDSVFSEDLPFVKVISNSGEVIDIEELLSFCDQCRENGYYVDQMRKFAIEHLSWKGEMKKIFDDYAQFKIRQS